MVACAWLCPSAWGTEAGSLELHNEFQVILGYDTVSVKTEKIQNANQEGENLICAKHLLCAGQHPEEFSTHCFTYAPQIHPCPEFNNQLTQTHRTSLSFGEEETRVGVSGTTQPARVAACKPHSGFFTFDKRDKGAKFYFDASRVFILCLPTSCPLTDKLAQRKGTVTFACKTARHRVQVVADFEYLSSFLACRLS